MDAQNQQQIEACVAALNRGSLTEEYLRQAFAAVAPADDAPAAAAASRA